MNTEKNQTYLKRKRKSKRKRVNDARRMCEHAHTE
jgi:hypothetical protein